MLQGIVFKQGLESGLDFVQQAKSQIQFSPTLATHTILCIGALENKDFLKYSQYFAIIKRGWWPIPNEVFNWLLDAHLDLY